MEVEVRLPETEVSLAMKPGFTTGTLEISKIRTFDLKNTEVTQLCPVVHIYPM